MIYHDLTKIKSSMCRAAHVRPGGTPYTMFVPIIAILGGASSSKVGDHYARQMLPIGLILPNSTHVFPPQSPLPLSFGGKSFAIDPRDLVFAAVDPTNPTGDCVSGIFESAGNIGGATEWPVGDVFLKNTYFEEPDFPCSARLESLTASRSLTSTARQA